MNGDMFEGAPTELRVSPLEIPDNAWPTVLAEYVDVLVAVLMRRGRSHEAALDEAQEAVIALAQHRGGRNDYLPTGERLIRAVRHRRIWLSWRGDNMEELMEKFQLTQRHLYQILHDQQVIAVRKYQGQLFPD